jgi:predicted permease
MTHIAQDIRFALRSFRKAPAFTAIAILSLALGIGANTAIFSLVDQLILRLLPIRDPKSLVLLAGKGRHYGGNNGRNALSYPMYQDLREKNTVFSGMMCRYSQPVAVGVSSQVEVIFGEFVSGNYFPVLGIGPAVGRVFTADDDLRAGAHPYAVLSYAYWKSRFSGDPKVIGQTIRVNNFPLTIVGVSQQGFDGVEPGLPAQIRIPITMAQAVRPAFTDLYNRRQRWVNVFGRLKPGVSMEQAKAGLQPLFHQIINMEIVQPPFRNASPYARQEFLKMWMDVMPGSQGNTFLRRQYENPLWILLGVVGLVLLIACTNLAGLLTARAAARQKEVAIRLAMGSTRMRLIRQLLTESLMLAVAGGVAGIAIALVMTKSLLSFLPANISGYNISSTPDGRALAFTFALSVAAAFAFGLAPALQATRPDIAPTLKDQAASVTGGGGQIGLRKLLVAFQVTLSLVLLIGAGLFIRSLANLRVANPGFRTSNLLEFDVNPRSVGYDPARATTFEQRLLERLRAIPGVRAAGDANLSILRNNEWDMWVTIEGYRPGPGESPDPHFNSITPGYFEAMGMHILDGRNFAAKDTTTSPKVAIVNAKFVRKYFKGTIPIGKHFGVGNDPGTKMDTEIIGVVNDAHYENLREEIPEQVFLADMQRPFFAGTMYVQTDRDARTAFGQVRSAVRDLDPNLPIMNLKTFERQISDSLVTERLIATLSTVFGFLATALVLIGLYGVMAFVVTRRSREIGIRMAVGALSSDVVRLVMREVLVLIGGGLALGIPAAWAITRIVRAQLYGIEPWDPASIVLATLLLAAVTAVAGYIPARRAALFDPLRILRYE